MKKDYRNIVIDDVKYQWLYNNKNQILSIFKIINEY